MAGDMIPADHRDKGNLRPFQVHFSWKDNTISITVYGDSCEDAAFKAGIFISNVFISTDGIKLVSVIESY